MTNPNQRPFISPPLRALNTNQPIIRTLLIKNNRVRLSKRTPKPRIKRSPVTEIPNIRIIRRLGIKFLLHILLSQLRKRPRTNPKIIKKLIYARQVRIPNPLKQEIRKSAPTVRTRYRCER